MDYEQKYAKALWQMKELYNRVKYLSSTEALLVSQTLENTFPELKESEDERIRKEIISIVKSYRESCITEGNHRFDDCISWLEKQGKKKASWSEEDEKMLDVIIGCMDGLCFIDSDHLNWLKSLKDRVQLRTKQEWDAQDEAFLGDAIIAAKNTFDKNCGQEELIDWLKSFKPHNWSPSKEQLAALETAISCRAMPWEQLETLYNDLKKL